MAGIEQGVGFPIRATDQFSGAFDKLKSQITGATSGFERLKGLMTATVAGLSIAGLAAIVDKAVEAAARFKDLAQESGTTASAISRFEEPARKAGSSLEAVSGAMFRLSQASIEARDPTSRAAQALRAIGIETEKIKGLKPDEFFELVARQASKYADGNEKNAVMQELLSKSGREMSKVLAEVADSQRLVATVTDEQAEAADRLGDQMTELRMTSEKFWRDLVADGVPAMNAILKAFVDARREGGLFNGVIAATANLFEQLAGNDLQSQLGRINAEIETAVSNVRNLQQNGRTFSLFGIDTGIEKTGTIAAAEKLNGLLEARANILALLAAGEKKVATEAKKNPLYDPAAAVRYAKMVEESKKYADANAHVAQFEEHRIKLAKLHNAEIEKELELEERSRQSKEGVIRGVREYAERLELELRLMGLSNAEREKAIALHTLEAAKLGISAEEMGKLANRVRDAVSAQEQMRDHLSVWNQLGDLAGAFFSELVLDGKSAFDSLKRYVKQLLAEMLAVFAKRWVLNMAGQGSLATQAGQGTVSGAGSDLMSTGMSMAGNYAATAAGFTGVGTMAGFTGAMTGAIPAAAIGAEAVAAGVGVNTAATALGSSLSGVYTALAAIPVWGWIAMAVIAIGAWIAGKHKGGPKVGGSFFSGGDVPGTDNGRFFTPSQGDEQMRMFVDATSQGYQDAISRLGGTAGAFNFGAGFDHDPNGTARSRVSSLVTDASGRQIYGMRDREMDDKEVEAALGLEAQRMVLAALQASDWSGATGVGNILNTVDVATATSEMITAVLGLADAFVQTMNLMKAINLDGVLAELSKGPMERFRSMGSDLQDLANKTKISADGLGQLARSTVEYRSAVVQMVAALEQAKRDIGAMFGETSRNIRMTTMGTQERYNFLQSEADSLLSQILTSTDANQIQAWAARINQNISDAFGLLSPDQQGAMQGDYLTRIEATNQAVQERLTQIQVETTTEANRILGEIRDALNLSAVKFEEAANTQLQAANIQRNTPIEVDIDVEVFDSRATASVVNGG